MPVCVETVFAKALKKLVGSIEDVALESMVMLSLTAFVKGVRRRLADVRCSHKDGILLNAWSMAFA